MPLETLEAYRDHGEPEVRIEQAAARAPGVMEGLAALGIDMGQVADELEEEGIVKFVQPFDSLLRALARAAA